MARSRIGMGDIHKNQEPVARSFSRHGGVRVGHIKKPGACRQVQDWQGRVGGSHKKPEAAHA